MSEAFVEVRMDFIVVCAIFLLHCLFFFRVCEFFEHGFRRFIGSGVVCVCDVGDGHGLGAVFLPDPVGIREIDSDRGRRIAAASKARGINDFGGYSLDALLLETAVDRSMVFEPLGIGTEQFSVPEFEIAGPVIFLKFADFLLLDIIFCYGFRLFQFLADLFECRAIYSADFPGFFTNHAVRTLYHLGIQAIRDRFWVFFVYDSGIIFFHLVSCDAFIEVYR